MRTLSSRCRQIPDRSGTRRRGRSRRGQSTRRGMRERGRRRPATAPRSSTCPQCRGRGHCSQPMERTPARRTRLRPIPCHTRTGVARAVAATIRRTDSRPTINAAKPSVTHRQQRAQPMAQAVAGAGRPFASCASPVRIAQTRCGGEVGRTWQRLRSHDLSAVTTHSTHHGCDSERERRIRQRDRELRRRRTATPLRSLRERPRKGRAAGARVRGGAVPSAAMASTAPSQQMWGRPVITKGSSRLIEGIRRALKSQI